MMNFKQKEVLENIIAELQKKFPEVRLTGIEELSPHEFWVILTEPDDEECRLALDTLQGELGTDALLDYGVNFHFMPAVVQFRNARTSKPGLESQSRFTPNPLVHIPNPPVSDEA